MCTLSETIVVELQYSIGFVKDWPATRRWPPPAPRPPLLASHTRPSPRTQSQSPVVPSGKLGWSRNYTFLIPRKI
jgi:hypothetical protein